MVANLVRRFLRWWLAELAALVPKALRVRSRQRGDALEFALTPEAVVVHHVHDGASQALGQMAAGAPPTEPDQAPETPIPDHLAVLADRFRPESTRCEVHVPAELALVREVTLPLAAAENLRQVLAFEMERQTPLRAEDVYYDYTVLERNPNEQQMKLRVGVVPRHVVDHALLPVKGWDLEHQLERPGGDGVGDSGVDFTFLSSRYRTRLTTRLVPTLVVANVLLLAAVVFVPLSQQSETLRELENELAVTKRKANATLAIQDRIAQLRAEAEFLTQRSVGHLPVVELLEELSALLPDSTWLFRLEIKDGKVQLQGTSVAASSLIATLEESEHLANVRFISPVLREANTGRERFHLSADIAEGGPGEEGATTARRGRRNSG